MRRNFVVMLFSAVCLALLAAPASSYAKKEEKAPDTTFKIVDLAKAKAKDIKALEKAVKKVEGVTVVVTAKKKNELKIWHKPEVTQDDLKAAVKGAGFKIEGDEEGGDEGGGDEGGADEGGGDEGGDDGY